MNKKKTEKEGKLIPWFTHIHMVILWLLNLPTCLQHKTSKSSSCVSKYVTFTGEKAAKKSSLVEQAVLPDT